MRLWRATNPNARDFRLETLGAVWTSRELTPEPDGAYLGFVPPPARGWTAFFVEVTFATAGVFKPDQAYTTDVLITPDVLPFAGTACAGRYANKDAIGVYHHGIWYLDANGNNQWDNCQQYGGADSCFFLGQAGDLPVVSH